MALYSSTKQGRKRGRSPGIFAAICLLLLATATISPAQQPAAPPSSDLTKYDIQRERAIVGTVIAYDAISASGPRGAHVTLQTSSGTLEIHLGNPRLLAASHFSIAVGDTLRIIGEPLASRDGTIFAARIVQNGTQAVTVRTERGILVPYVAPRAAQPASASQRSLP